MKNLSCLIIKLAAVAALMLLPCACANGQVKADTAPASEKAQPDKEQAKTTEVPEPGKQPEEAKTSESYAGTLSLVNAQDIKIEMKAYNGELIIDSIIDPRTPVKKGDVIAKLIAPDMEEMLANSRNNLETNELTCISTNDQLKRLADSEKLEMEKAEFAFKTAEENLAKWQSEERADRIRSAELQLEWSKAGIDDQKDELAQLDKLYEGNELAKESEEIVLKRARRRLKQSEESLVLQERANKRLLEYDMPRTDKEKTLALESAREVLAKLKAEQGMNLKQKNTELALNRAEIAREKASKRIDDLRADMECLIVKAPIDGVAVIGAVAGNTGAAATIKHNDKLRPGTVIAGVIDTTTFIVTIQVPAKRAASIVAGAGVMVKIDALEIEIPGKVKARSLIAKADKVDVYVEFTCKDRTVFSGLSATVTFPEE